MQRRNLVVIILLIVIGACITCYVARLSTKNQIENGFNFSNVTSEEVFQRYILEYGASIPSEVKQIQGIEGKIFGYAGPAYIRFQATNKFINGIIEKGYVDPFVEIPCHDFLEASSKYLVKNYPKKFEWWHPTEVTSPICYHAQGGQYDDAKYLLVDNDDEVVYFYRTPTCGLCPN